LFLPPVFATGQGNLPRVLKIELLADICK
jgi:hypothetical protein